MEFNKQKVVTSQLDLSSADARTEGAECLHIAYGIDRHFLYGCGISIASILQKNPSIAFTFHVFTDYFDSEQERLFQQLAQQYKTAIKIYLIDCEQLRLLPSTKNWSYATYFRFIITDYFADQLTRLIYMDADIICQGSLNELLTLNFKQNEIVAVVADSDHDLWRNRAEALGVPAIASGYFNAGFLLINLPGWSVNKISARAAELLSQEDIKAKITYLDQDILNMLLAGQVVFLEQKYNTQYSINYELQKNKPANLITANTVLIHYIGPTKPWHEWANYATAQPFLEAKMASPWKDVPLLKAKTSNHLRYYAKHQFLQKNYYCGITAYMKYFLKKLAIMMGVSKR